MTSGNDLQPAMTRSEDAFFKEGCNITNTNNKNSYFIYAKVKLLFF